MPFTLSHSAAVLPFARSKHLSATALIIGSMAPDFEYFFRMNVQGIYGHTIPGIFYFDIPVITMLAFVFHLIVKKPLIDNLPVFLQSRFQDVRNSDFVSYIKDHKLDFVISAILGTATHIIWDGFTHQRQFFVTALPGIYEGRFVHFMGVDYPLWYALQYVSTIVGLIFLGIYVLMIKPASGSFRSPNIFYWITLALFVAIVTTIRMQWPVISEKYVVIVITIVSSFCLGITILGLIPWQRRSNHSGYK